MTTFTKSAYLAICLCVTLFLSSCAGGAPSSNSGSPGGNPGNPSPSVTSLSPNSAVAGASAQTLTIAGTGFLASSTVTYNGVAHRATYVSSTQLTIQLTASDQATAGTFPVVVTNPTPGGGSSTAVNFTVNNPAPTITSLSPNSVTAGAAAQTLTINGTGFVSVSTVTYDGVAHVATFVSATQLTIQLSASDQATAGTYPVVVTNPSPGGGVSKSVGFYVTNPTVPGAFVFTGSLNAARYDHTATLLNNGLVLFAAGSNQNMPLGPSAEASAELYDPATGTFAATGSLNNARLTQTATLLDNGMVLIVGGFNGNTVLASAELYNPATGTFTATGSLNIARYWHTATLLDNGMVLIAGGLNSSNVPVANAELYNPATGTFTLTGSLNTPRWLHRATLLNNGMVLISGGAVDYSRDPTASAELYNPATGTFTATGSLNTARYNHTATLLNNGMVLIAGGSYDANGDVTASAELYNPATGTFTATGSLNTARASHTATLLNNGMVLVAGGDYAATQGDATASAELYDPASGTFTPTGSLNNARALYTGTLLGNGTVLVAGGAAASSSVLASAELYQPVTLTPPNLVSIAISPATSTLSPGTTQQFIATGTFSNSTTQQLASVTWSSSDTTVAEISNDATNRGVGLAIASGTVTITATAGSVSGSATLTVSSTVNNSVPTITSLSPSSATAGAAAQTLTINGTNFLPTSTVTYNGVAHTATYVNSTDLTIQLTVADQATAGSYPVVVTNPGPGGGASNTVDFTVNTSTNPVPTITGLSPTAVFAGSSAQTLTITGTGFLSGSTVTFNGVAQTATLASSTQLTIPLTANDQTTGGNFAVVVTNPSPGGGASNSENFVVYTGFTAPTWQVLGPRSVPNAHSCDSTNETNLTSAGRIQAFAIDLANPSLMYAGGGVGTGNSGPDSDAGVYMSTDGGTHWTAEDTGLGDTFVDALWMDQSNSSILLASTWLDGIYRTTNGGSSWTNVYSAQTTSIVQAGSSLYAATSNGVAVSTDDGATWTIGEATTSPVRTLGYGNGMLYAGLDNGDILSEPSLSGPWSTVYTAPANTTAYDIAVNPSNGKVAIIVLNAAGTMENLVTTDGGTSWNTWSGPPTGGLCGSGGPAKVVAFDTVNSSLIYAGSGGAIYVSTDGGSSWSVQHMFEDVNLIEPFPGETGEVAVGGDQGIYISQDSGSTWNSLNGDLSTNLLNSLAVNGSNIISTIQDFSPVQTFDGGTSWLQLSGSAPAVGENGVVVINQGNPNYQYIFNGVGFQYSTDGGNTFTNDTSLPSGQWNFGAPMAAVAVDPQTPSTLYLAGASGVFESTDWGVTWTLTSWGFQNPSLVSVGPDGTIFVGTPATSTAPGELHISHNAGASWATFQCPISWPVSLTVDPNNTNTILMVTGAPPNVTGGGVLISTDGGNTFSSDNSGLSTRASIPAPFSNYTIQFAPAAYPGLVVLTTDDGAYISQAGSAWTNISGSAVLQFFYGLAWDSGYLYVSTYGEGVLRIPITQVLTP